MQYDEFYMRSKNWQVTNQYYSRCSETLDPVSTTAGVVKHLTQSVLLQV